MSDVLLCRACKIHAIHLYKVAGKIVCRACRKDYAKNKKFSREKVNHDYTAAMRYVEEQTRLHEQREREGISRKW